MIRAAGRGAWLGLALLLVGGTARAQAVHVGLVPSTPSPALGETVDIRVELLEVSPGMNAYELEIAFDPDHLEPVPLVPLQDQEGDLMTSACPTRWHRLDSSPGRLILSHAILCSGTRVTGPGELYRFRFRVLRSGPSTVGLRAVRFADGGIDLTPHVDADLDLQIPDPAPFAVRAQPNPFRSSTRIEMRAERDGEATIDLLSARGALVRSIGPLSLTAGVVLGVEWDGIDAAGRTTPAGVYFVRVRGSAIRTTARIVRVP